MVDALCGLDALKNRGFLILPVRWKQHHDRLADRLCGLPQLPRLIRQQCSRKSHKSLSRGGSLRRINVDMARALTMSDITSSGCVELVITRSNAASLPAAHLTGSSQVA